MHLLAQVQGADLATKEAGLDTLRQVYVENQKYEHDLLVPIVFNNFGANYLFQQIYAESGA